MDDLFAALGFNKPAPDAAIGVIAARLVAPSSERATHLWLQDPTALDELLAADITTLSQDRVYKTSDRLLRYKKEIEDHLQARECSLFNLTEVFEGNVSEPGTLERMITTLSRAKSQTRPLVKLRSHHRQAGGPLKKTPFYSKGTDALHLTGFEPLRVK